MKINLFAATAVAAFLFVAPAFADAPDEVNTNNHNGGNTTVTATGGNLTNAPVTNLTDVNVNNLTNRQGQLQGQSQDVRTNSSASSNQAQSAIVNSSGNSQVNSSVSPTISNGATGSGNSTSVVTNYQRPHRSVASAVAPNLYLGECNSGGAFAVQAAKFGVSVGGGKVRKACEVNQRAALLNSLGYPDIAINYLARFDRTLADVLASAPKAEAPVAGGTPAGPEAPAPTPKAERKPRG